MLFGGESLFLNMVRMSEVGSLNLSLGIRGRVVGVSFLVSGMSLMSWGRSIIMVWASLLGLVCLFVYGLMTG